MSDDSIVRALAADPNNQQLWLAFFEKLRPAVYYSMYRACRGERDLASDLTQDAFERFFKYANLKRFTNDRHALAYLRQIARHRLISELNRTHAEPFSELALEDPPDPAGSAGADTVEMQHDIALLAEELGPSDRALLSQLLAGEGVEEIARKLEIPYGTAAVRVHRLIDKIRLKLKDLESRR